VHRVGGARRQKQGGEERDGGLTDGRVFGWGKGKGVRFGAYCRGQRPGLAWAVGFVQRSGADVVGDSLHSRVTQSLW
jgi:hypothetical protein